MDIESYLENGGVLTSPANVPPRYRAELLKLMATFVDSELAGAAGFADMINKGPGIAERLAAARIVLEKTDHAREVLVLMGEFGANTARYVDHHPWTARLERGADTGAQRSESDMRLAVFNYPLEGWADAVMMNQLMGLAVAEQLEDMKTVSYQPLAEVIRAIAPKEAHHTELASEGLTKLSEGDESKALAASAAYWWPRVAASFSDASPEKWAQLKALGLRGRDGASQRASWEKAAKARLESLGIAVPKR